MNVCLKEKQARQVSVLPTGRFLFFKFTRSKCTMLHRGDSSLSFCSPVVIHEKTPSDTILYSYRQCLLIASQRHASPHQNEPFCSRAIEPFNKTGRSLPKP